MKLINKIKKIKHKELWFNSMTGMTIGFLATLVVGVLIGMFGMYSKDNVFIHVKHALYFICPFAIGVGVGMKHKVKPIASLAIGFASFLVAKSEIIPQLENGTNFVFDDVHWNVSTSFSPGDVFAAWLVGASMLYFFELYKFETRVDLFLIPLIGLGIGFIDMSWLTYLTTLLAIFFEFIIEQTINHALWKGLLLAPIFGIVIGYALSLPTSSAAMAMVLSLKGDAALVALSATSAQMISFGVMTYIATNDISKSFAVGFGSPMLQMNNYVRKPKILIIPGIVSALVALIGLASFHGTIPFNEMSPASGMGTSALAGPIMSLDMNGWDNWHMWLHILAIQLALPALLTAPMAWYGVKKEWLVKSYLMI